MNEIMNIGGIKCYEKDGTAYLNLEACARGLGFTETKNGKEYIMWRRVHGFLEEFGFGTSTEKPVINLGDGANTDDYIPENIFYRLAIGLLVRDFFQLGEISSLCACTSTAGRSSRNIRNYKASTRSNE